MVSMAKKRELDCRHSMCSMRPSGKAEAETESLKRLASVPRLSRSPRRRSAVRSLPCIMTIDYDYWYCTICLAAKLAMVSLVTSLKGKARLPLTSQAVDPGGRPSGPHPYHCHHPAPRHDESHLVRSGEAPRSACLMECTVPPADS